jgi:hypothetical protein
MGTYKLPELDPDPDLNVKIPDPDQQFCPHSIKYWLLLSTNSSLRPFP